MARVVAEIGCNHGGDFALACRMVTIAATVCGVDVVKFQKRSIRTLLSSDAYAAPHPDPLHAFGPTYGAHREALEFSVDQHRELQELCRSLGVDYATSVWDEDSARAMAALEPVLLKVPSAANLNKRLLSVLADSFPGQIHVSLGMTTREEAEAIVTFFHERGRAADLVLYACTSAYPADFADLCLLEISRLCATFGGTVKAIGFSGHHRGIAADIAALALGAEWIERHFTLDRTSRGTDHAASLEPDGLRRLSRDIRAVTLALQHRPADLLPAERAQRLKLKQEHQL